MDINSPHLKRKILEILGIQITPDLIFRLIETNKNDAFTDYTAEIIENFELFDTAIFRTFDHNKNLNENSAFNLILENKTKEVTVSKIKNLVNTITLEYGKDRRGKLDWTNEDDKGISTYWTGREWIVDKNKNTLEEFEAGCSQINFSFDFDDGIGLSILGANINI